MPFVFSAPTVMANGELPGAVMHAIDGPPVLGLAEVAGRCDDRDAGAVGALDRLAQGVVAPALRHRPAERHVDDSDVEARAIGDRPVDGLDHIAGKAPALRVQDLQADDVRARRHARGLVEAVAAGSSDDPRHVRAVAVLVKSQYRDRR